MREGGGGGWTRGVGEEEEGVEEGPIIQAS